MSKNYKKVKQYYEKGYWPEKWVRDAVNRWITPDEFHEITGEKFKKVKA